jgi:hypothetical protein
MLTAQYGIGGTVERVASAFREGQLALVTTSTIDSERLGLLVLTSQEAERWLAGFQPVEEWPYDEFIGVGRIDGDRVVIYPDDRLPGVTTPVFLFRRHGGAFLAHRVELAGGEPPDKVEPVVEKCSAIVTGDYNDERCAVGTCETGRCVPLMSSSEGVTHAVGCWCQ